MEPGDVRTLDENERRKIAARVLAPSLRATLADGIAARKPFQSQREKAGSARAGRGGARRRGQRRSSSPARVLAALLLALPVQAGFPAAFCAAAAAWGLALAAAMAWSGVVAW